MLQKEETPEKQDKANENQNTPNSPGESKAGNFTQTRLLRKHSKGTSSRGGGSSSPRRSTSTVVVVVGVVVVAVVVASTTTVT